MTIARKVLSMGAAGALMASLAGCMTGGPEQPPMAAAPKGVEGSWIDAKAVSYTHLTLPTNREV